MASSEIQTGESTRHINQGSDDSSNHQLVEMAGESDVGVVGEMGETEEVLKVTSVMSHNGDHAGMQEEVHYVTTDETGQAVTIVYPQSTIPLLRATDGSLVNFVELPGVHGELELDQGALSGETGMILQQDFTGEGPVTIVAADDTSEQFSLLSQGPEHSTMTMNTGDGHTITYLTATEDGVAGSPTAILGDHLIQIPANDQSGSSHTITLPLSILNDGSGVSILQGLSNLQLPLMSDTGESVTLASAIDSEHITVSGPEDSQSHTLSELSPSVATSVGTTPNTAHSHGANRRQQSLLVASQLPASSNSSKSATASGNKQSLVFKTNNILSKQSSNNQPKKLIGTGPMAISAQGVVQKIGNRLVTVLPRPEDLKRLQDSKSLILSVKGSGDSSNDFNGFKGQRTRRVPVPVRPHQRFGRRGRGGNRGRPPNVMKEINFHNDANRSISLLKKDMNNSVLIGEVPGENNFGTCIKLEDTNGEGIVVDMTLPGGSPASAVLVKGPPEDEDYTLPEFSVPIPIVSRRGRRKKRGRGRPRGTYVISSTGRRPGRPRKVETLLEGPHGARMIHTGPDTRLDGEHTEGNELSTDVTSIELAGIDVSDGLEEMQVLDMGNLKQEPIDIQPRKEEVVDPNKRKLPPRRRGARYEKMIQALVKSEYEDDFSMEEEDFSPDYLTNRRAPPVAKAKGTSGPGKRGRPRKNWPAPSVTESIKLEPGITQHSIIETTHITDVAHEDLMTTMAGVELSGSDKHNLLISFQKPETGEMVITMLPPPPGAEHQQETPEQATEGTQTEDIDLPLDELEINGHKCEECGEIIQFKRDYIRHLRQKHDLRPFECDQCEMSPFVS